MIIRLAAERILLLIEGFLQKRDGLRPSARPPAPFNHHFAPEWHHSVLREPRIHRFRRVAPLFHQPHTVLNAAPDEIAVVFTAKLPIQRFPLGIEPLFRIFRRVEAPHQRIHTAILQIICDCVVAVRGQPVKHLLMQIIVGAFRDLFPDGAAGT